MKSEEWVYFEASDGRGVQAYVTPDENAFTGSTDVCLYFCHSFTVRTLQAMVNNANYFSQHSTRVLVVPNKPKHNIPESKITQFKEENGIDLIWNLGQKESNISKDFHNLLKTAISREYEGQCEKLDSIL